VWPGNAQTRKSDSPALIDGRSVEMNVCIPLEKITDSLGKKYEFFFKYLAALLEYNTNATIGLTIHSMHCVIAVSVLCH